MPASSPLNPTPPQREPAKNLGFPSHTYFWCGLVGSLMPTVIRAFQLYGEGKTLPVTNWPVFIACAILYAVCAGLFARWWRPESEFKAVWVGISFSVLVTNLFQNFPGIPH